MLPQAILQSKYHPYCTLTVTFLTKPNITIYPLEFAPHTDSTMITPTEPQQPATDTTSAAHTISLQQPPAVLPPPPLKRIPRIINQA